MTAYRIWGPRALWLGVMLLMTGVNSARALEDFWPQVLEGEKGTITIYQPQVESFSGDILQTRAAVAVKRNGEDKLVFGAVWFKTRLLTDRDTRLATLAQVEVTAARFPELDAGQVETMSRFMEQEIPRWDLEFSLDNLLADLADQEERARELESFNMAPPEIIYRDRSAVLVLVDGEPHFRPVEDSKLEYLANSAFFMVRLQGGRSLFLRGAGLWFTSTDLTGQWQVADKLPPEVAALTGKLEEDERKQAEEMAADAGDLGIGKAEDPAPPEVVVRTEPAELVFTTGAADLAPVAGTQVLYVRNSASDILMDISSQKYFLLLSGRWYRSDSLEKGPWEYVDPERLPEDFARIPPDSDASGVLASVPGTLEAQEAVLDNQIPQTAEVDRKTAKVTVNYDGDPQFESCGKGVAYATNTDKTVLLIDKTYYCCDEAIWFVSKRPEGPWVVATELPDVIQDLPPECPVYNVKYVTIFESTPEVVYVGYYPGYYGSYVYGPCVVYGTGWYYRPWYGHYYYPRPVTYGFGVHYNPWTGWGFTFGVSYSWLHVGVGYYRPPSHGMWGAAGYRYGYRAGYMHGYHHGRHHGYPQGARASTMPAARHNQSNIYKQRSEGVNRTGGDRRPDGRTPKPSDRQNNVYTDRDGKVYRDQGGKWEERDKGDWKSRGEDQPATRQQPSQRDGQQQLDRDRASRQRGNDRQGQPPQRKAPSGGGRRR